MSYVRFMESDVTFSMCLEEICRIIILICVHAIKSVLRLFYGGVMSVMVILLSLSFSFSFSLSISQK